MTEKQAPADDFMCKGAWELGTACGECPRCVATKPSELALALALHSAGQNAAMEPTMPKLPHGVMIGRPHEEVWTKAQVLAFGDAAFAAGKKAVAPDAPLINEGTTPAQEPVKLRFPTVLRKMWSGGEVQDWLNRQPALYATPQPAAAPDYCPNCGGSGTVMILSNSGPDAYDMPDTCPHCNGDQTLKAAYEGVCKLLEKSHAEYTQACGVIWAGKHLPKQPAAAPEPVTDAQKAALWDAAVCKNPESALDAAIDFFQAIEPKPPAGKGATQ